MLMLNHLVGFGYRRLPSGLIVGTGGIDGSTASGTTLTLSSKALGAAAANRSVLVMCGGVDNATVFGVNSVTVGGVSATEQADRSDGNSCAAIYTAAVPTGTTGDIVVTFSEAIANMRWAAWLPVYGLTSLTPFEQNDDGLTSQAAYGNIGSGAVGDLFFSGLTLQASSDVSLLANWSVDSGVAPTPTVLGTFADGSDVGWASWGVAEDTVDSLKPKPEDFTSTSGVATYAGWR